MKPDVIIELAGGLGNQMFQFAFFMKMRHLGYPCKIFYDEAQRIHNGPEIDKVFGVQLLYASKEELNKVLDQKKDIFSRALRKAGGSQHSAYWEHDKGYHFKPEIFRQQKPVYLQGCWLSPMYFHDIAEQVRRTFYFPEITDGVNSEVLMKIQKSPCSVAIHARFGDYLSSAVHFNLDYEDYLKKAIDRLPVTVRPDFFIFSDDIERAKTIFEKKKDEDNYFHFVRGNGSNHSWIDMALMSKCSHQIIANSTFSWWAAWLNDNPHKTVIAPKNWFTITQWNQNDLLPAEWIKI